MFRTKRLIFVCALVTILIVVGSSSNNFFVNPSESSIETQTGAQLIIPSDSYTFHSPIDINSNADFSSQGWPGNGTLGNPYVIEGLIIRVDVPCISITGTTVHFEIRSCFITSVHPSDREGIFFDRVDNGTITNCIIDLHIRGVYLKDSFNCNITNNIASNNRYTGFRLDDSSNCTLINNTASDEYRGFSLSSSENCILSNNTASNNYHSGISISSSIRCTLTNNTLVNNGFVISAGIVTHWFHDSWGNTVNNKPLGYFMNLTNTTIDCSQYSQIILVNCTNVIARNGTFSNVSIGMQLGFCTNCTLEHNTVSNNLNAGVRMQYSDTCTLRDNCAFNNDIGFYLFISNNCTLLNNIASSNDYGFLLEFSYNCILVHDIGYNNSFYGFHLRFLENCSLTNNTAFNNTRHGFYLENVENCILMNNTASNNYNGLHFGFSAYCTILNNTVTSNKGYGISLDDQSEHNVLYLNRLGDNAISNAADEGRFNTWDDGVSSGNYWMDYNGEGTYLIPGDSGSVDNYPFVWKPVPQTDDNSLILVLVGSGIVGILGVTIIIFVYKMKHAKSS